MAIARRRRLSPADLLGYASPFAKNISLHGLVDTALVIPIVLPSSIGAFRDRHERWVRDAMDAFGAADECTGGGRRSRVVLMSRRWHHICE